MKLKKKEKIALKRTCMIAFLFCGVFIIISYLAYEKPVIKPGHPSLPQVSNEVQGYHPLVEKYAIKYEVDDYVDVMLAMMMQESGGRGLDPMQSSESYCGQRGCIDDPEVSIKQGVYYFSKTLDKADGDLKLAIQSYNFGLGFIDYVQERSKNYSQEVAIDFSQEMYQNARDKSIYSCLREEAKKFDACYGDIYYVSSVMKYRDVLAAE